jgi:hypothetical protein
VSAPRLPEWHRSLISASVPAIRHVTGLTETLSCKRKAGPVGTGLTVG